MQDAIDKAIDYLNERAVKDYNQDDIMKITQSISNLTHAKINLAQYSMLEKEMK
tara:strand:+ start:16021 stop:16182 length:162 start_codon:yes stop_codon:yes gene_type:complete